MTQWQYNEENDVYWQVGIAYCEYPADETYEKLGIYVPGAYMTGTENGDGTYTCEANPTGVVEGYTVQTGKFGRRGGPGERPERGDGMQEQYAMDGIDRKETSGGITLTGTYETVQDYMDALNAEKTWVTYDSGTNTATITSVADFVSAFKFASKNLGAFDALDESQGENELFGDGDGSGAHFDTALTTEVNLALALENCGADVDFETVWGQAHVEAERTGGSTTNFIEWVNACLK